LKQNNKRCARYLGTKKYKVKIFEIGKFEEIITPLLLKMNKKWNASIN
jgi:hypothetical protein